VFDKDSYITGESFSTQSSYKQNKQIREHVSSILLGTNPVYAFPWDYWITITFGYDPSLSECEDVLYRAHLRFDTRVLKHCKDRSVINDKERSRWLLFPEIDSDRKLHYHGFIKLLVKPNLGTSYENEWFWLRAAFKDTFKVLNRYLSNGAKIDFRFYKNGKRVRDRLKIVLYSTKELTKGSTHQDIDPNFDRFAHLIISDLDWKPSPLRRHKLITKVEHLPERPNKIGIGALGI